VKDYKAGQIVFGRYALDRPLARGGMSSVWVATDRKLQREVAVKLMAPAFASSEAFRQRFEREAMTVARLQSPHIVQVYDYGVDHRSPFIVMELMSGEDLRRRLKRMGRLPLQETGRLLVHAALGLGEAHAAGLVHRDLKPANLYLVRTRSGELVKILDFGIVKAAAAPEIDEDEITEKGSLIGTPQYMSPEQIRSLSDIDFRSDLFSLGVIIYRTLTGKLPFRGKNAHDLGVNICTGGYVEPTEIAPDLPPGVDDFIRQALMVEREDRFASAQEMAEAYARITPESYATMVGPMSGGGYSGPGIVPSDPGQIMGPPTAPSWVTTAGLAPGSSAGPPSNAHGMSESAIITGVASVAGAESQPVVSGTFNPADPLFSSQSGSLATATVDDLATLEKPPGQRRKLVIAGVIVGILLLLLMVGTLVGGSDTGETRAEPTATPTGQAPAGTKTVTTATGTVTAEPSATETSDDDDGDDGDDDDDDETQAPPPKGGKKGGKKPPKPPPPKGGDDYDPFKSRK
jgi:serine/threonine protein kinase